MFRKSSAVKLDKKYVNHQESYRAASKIIIIFDTNAKARHLPNGALIHISVIRIELIWNNHSVFLHWKDADKRDTLSRIQGSPTPRTFWFSFCTGTRQSWFPDNGLMTQIEWFQPGKSTSNTVCRFLMTFWPNRVKDA